MIPGLVFPAGCPPYRTRPVVPVVHGRDASRFDRCPRRVRPCAHCLALGGRCPVDPRVQLPPCLDAVPAVRWARKKGRCAPFVYRSCRVSHTRKIAMVVGSSA